MDINECIKEINELAIYEDKLKAEIEAKELKIKEIQDKMNPLKEDLLQYMKDEGLSEYRNDGLVSILDSRKTTGYSKDEEKCILEILKEKNLLNCISLKESLAKRELNKELKINEELKESLKDFGQEKTTEFVMVMTEDCAARRLEHINENLNNRS